MQVKTIEREKLVNRLVDVFADSNLTSEYRKDSDIRVGICGWNGVMSPLTRCTYIQDFGEAAVVEAEAEARKIIAERAEWLANTQYIQHEEVANSLSNQGTNYCPAKGDFVWCICSGLKANGGLPHEIHSQVYSDSKTDKQPVLVFLQDVCKITDSELMDPKKAEQLVQSFNLEGGSRSDDVDIQTFQEWNCLNDEQKKTFYIVGAAVVTPSGKWYVIDSEGYDYARYIYLPLLWREILKPEVDEIEACHRQEIEDERKRIADEKAKRYASYVASCNKWEPLMISIQPLIDAAKNHRYDSPKYKAAERAINNACRKNILTMVQTAFPGVKFRLLKHTGWGCDWELSWIDGPSKSEFFAATDLKLFCSRVDTYDGMEDYADVKYMEFTDFASKYMCGGGNVEVQRELSAEVKDEMQSVIKAIKLESCRDDDRVYWSDDELEAISNQYGITFDESTMNRNGIYNRCCSPYTLIRILSDIVSFYKPQEIVPEIEKGNGSSKSAKQISNENNDTPHVSLSLKKMDGGVYVDGSSRATYYNRREIKAHGAKWNKDSQRWEATTPESIAQLCEWFGMEAS